MSHEKSYGYMVKLQEKEFTSRQAAFDSVKRGKHMRFKSNHCSHPPTNLILSLILEWERNNSWSLAFIRVNTIETQSIYHNLIGEMDLHLPSHL